MLRTLSVVFTRKRRSSSPDREGGFFPALGLKVKTGLDLILCTHRQRFKWPLGPGFPSDQRAGDPAGQMTVPRNAGMDGQQTPEKRVSVQECDGDRADHFEESPL